MRLASCDSSPHWCSGFVARRPKRRGLVQSLRGFSVASGQAVQAMEDSLASLRKEQVGAAKPSHGEWTNISVTCAMAG